MLGEELQTSFLENLHHDLRAAQSHSSKTIMLNNIYGRLSLTLVRANVRAFNARVATTMDLLEG